MRVDSLVGRPPQTSHDKPRSHDAATESVSGAPHISEPAKNFHGRLGEARSQPVIPVRTGGVPLRAYRPANQKGGNGLPLLRAVIWSGALAFTPILTASPASAQQVLQQAAYDIRIEAGTLADALVELARQTNVKLLFPYELASATTVQPLSGRYTFEDALTALLQGTGFSGGLVREGVARVTPPARINQREETVSPKTKASILTGVSTLVMGAFSAPSYAQEAAVAPQRDVVVVTAQRREQDLQEVPLSVSAFSSEELEDIGVAELTEVGKFTPNVTLEVSRGTNSTLTAFIRGVGQQDPVGGFEAGVGIYIDDVYLNRPQGAVLDVFDIERIEVLRGPQGTLYGRNTIGGAVKYVTRRLASKPAGKFRLSVGDYGRLEGVATASTPLSDTFRVGASVAGLTHDGYGDNLYLNGVENYNKEVVAARVAAEWDASDTLQFRFSGDYLHDTSDPRQGHRLIPGQISNTPVLGDVYDTQAGLAQPTQDLIAKGASLVGEWEISDSWTLKNILAYREDASSTPIDFDSLPAIDVDVPAIYENDQFSEELQLLYSGDRLNGLVGVYYLDANALTAFDVVLGTTGDLISLPGLNAQTYGDVNTDTWSIFADFTYDITDTVSLTLGGRYTNDTRSSEVLRRTFIGGYSPLFGGTAVPIATTSNFNGEKEFTDFSPRFSVAWEAAPEQNLYFTYGQGFKGGGFDPRGQTSAAPDLDQNGTVSEKEIFEFMQFDPEQVDSYEIGWKGTHFNGRAQTSLAAFYMDYQDVQVPGSIGVDTNNDGINDTFTGVTTNAGAATIKGLEFDGMVHVGEDWITSGDALDFTTSIGYIDAKYDEFVDAFGVNVADQRVFQNTPEWTASGRLSYVAPVGWFGSTGTFSIIGSGSYRGDSSQFEAPNPYLDQEAYTLWDLSMVYRNDNGWSLGLHGKNLTDEEYKVAGYNFVSINPATNVITPTLGLEGTLTAFYGDPRTLTLTLGYEF